jgi:hypothetical protein
MAGTRDDDLQYGVQSCPAAVMAERLKSGLPPALAEGQAR